MPQLSPCRSSDLRSKMLDLDLENKILISIVSRLFMSLDLENTLDLDLVQKSRSERSLYI